MNDKKIQKELGQFFTPTNVATLVTRFVGESVSDSIDLAAGFGDLLTAVLSNHKNASVSALDIDSLSISKLNQLFPNGDIIKANALKLSRTNQKRVREGGFDLAVGNPPFNRQQASSWTLKVIRDELDLDCTKYSSVRAEVAFLALSLLATKTNGYVSLILPKTMAAGESWQWLRRVLLKKHSIIAVASLPASVFQNTEVETCVLTLKKNRPTTSKIQLLDCDKNGNEISSVWISPKDAIYRLDHDYHSWRLRHTHGEYETLAQAGIQVVRGNIHSKKARDMGIEIFHTSSFNKLNQGMAYFPELPLELSSSLVSVSKDDILIPRIGRNLNHLAKVASGQSVISDCVFGLRAPKERIDDLHKSLESEQTKGWIKVHTSGACAKLISKSNLLNMPLMK
ncbi:MAG: N-6 DNA methylase [Oleispira sp.]|nr:N-6 DNA methylase [Oleispira sp.]MBL4880211.1 N-6 DNA methylase [Oleispira sp.]